MSPPELQDSSFPRRRDPLPTDSNPERGASQRLGSRIGGGSAAIGSDSVYGMDAASKGPMLQLRPGVPTASSSTLHSTREGSSLPYTTSPVSPRSPQITSPSPRSPNSFPSSSSPKMSLGSSQTFHSTQPQESPLRQSLTTPSQSSLREPTRRSPASSRNNSLRRKPPPPLDFSPDNSPRSQTQVDHTESPTRSIPRRQQATVPETPNREEEQRDTLSNLPSNESPSINLSIPSSNLQFGSSGDFRDAADLDRDDDTIGSGVSFLSSSTSSSRDIEADDQPRPYQPSSLLSSSTTGYEQGNSARPYQGVGLGLPFSVSAAANLSSLASRAPLSSSHPLPIDIPSPTAHQYISQDPYRSPRVGDDQNGRSPVVDRNQLIGLGELATPRWTSAALERRWGAPAEQGGNTDVFDVHDPMPQPRTMDVTVESPTTSRRIPYDSNPSNRPFGNSGLSSLQPASLLPHSSSTNSISTQLSPVGLLNFGQDSASTFGNLEFTPTSPVYSLNAASSEDSPPLDSSIPNKNQQGATARGSTQPELERSQPAEQTRGKSLAGASSSASSSAGIDTAPTWVGGSEKDVVGLGFDYSTGGSGSGGGEDAETGSRRRISHGSVASAPSKRSSHRSSIDGKAALRHRRQSASKSSFAHLPPSPAASTAHHSLSSSTTSLPQPNVAPTNPHPLPPAPPQPTSSSHSTPSTRTPEHSRVSRHSFHSHHSSPSLVAASILRHTRDLEGVDLDIEKAAAVDEGTAEALRKLDGLSSPKMARIASGSSASGFSGGGGAEPRSRKSSRGFIEVPTPRKDSLGGEDRVRRRTRSSLADGGDSSNLAEGTATTPGNSSPAGYSSPALPSNQSMPPKSPLANSTSSTSTSRPLPQRVPSYEVPFPSASSPYKRGSSSSASYTIATSTSASGSHDSTSGTSFASRSAASKARRSSGGSDISSIHSGNDARPGVERTDSAGEGDQVRGIPPVPPLPKDWETYRPTTASTTGGPLSASTTTTTSSISFPSPRPEYDTRRPSFASSLENSFRSSPRAPSSEEVKNGQEIGKIPTPTSRRKWSISSAFHKASKSPKTGSSGIKESSSFSDLQAPSQRDRKASSFGPRLGLGESTQLPKRLASSTSDIASLASSRSEYSLSNAGSIGRSSMRSDKASIIARARTSSVSSSGTARTTNQQIGPASTVNTPAVVTTSPGRSRSSLINPRRTPSGIPFFSRKSSNNSIEPTSSTATPSPNAEKTSGEEKNGRKSILGLNFLRSGGSKRDKDKSTLSPPSSTNRSTFSASNSSSSLHADSVGLDEFGRRAGKSSDPATRKRGKTLSSVDAKNDEIFGSKSQPTQLPPFQMPALSSTTSKRVDALNASQASNSSTSSYPKTPSSPAGSVLQTPRTRTSKLQESMRAHLPTIAGSPSTRVPTAAAAGSAGESRVSSQGPSPSGTPPPKSRTPTKIPRFGRIGGAASSPKPLRSSRNNSPSSATVATKSAWRRSSSFGGPGDTSNPLAASFTGSLAPSAYDNNDSTSEFGSVNRDPGLQLGEKTLSTRRRLESDATLSSTSGIPRSKSTSASTFSSARDPILSSSTSSSRQSTALPRVATRRPSVVEEEKRATTTTASIPIAATPARSNQPRLSSLSASAPRASTQFTSESSLSSSTNKRVPLKTNETNILPRRTSLANSTGELLSSSKSSRTLSTKGAIPTRVSKISSAPSSTRLSSSGTESGRSSSASQRDVDEDEVRGDEEMGAYVRRQYSKKLSAGMSEEAIRKMFEFPDPTDPLPPLDSKDALSLYSRFLSPYEKDEIRDYRKVYFVGPNCEKKLATKEHTTNNYGYDDERGDYLLVPHDHLHYRYEVINVLGKGSFGQVLQCRDHKTGDMVAIKIIRNKKRFHHQALVEIKVLENLVKWDPNEKHFVIRMVDSFTFRGHLCIVTELLSINLYELVKANSFAGFSTTLIRRFTVQILGSLSLLRHHRVVHCDLKPENILLKHPAKSAIKVIDFGSSCFEHEKVYTYIQSRFYRSPEVILGMNYHMGIDMWSLGCIIAEMYTGYPIFPGENEQEQLACIMEVMGLPDKYLVDRSSRKRLFFDSTGAPRPVVNSKGRRRRPGSKTLAQVLKTDDELFIDFIAKCLIWDPDRRLKPDPAMRHPWITQTRASIPPSIPPPRASRSSGLPTSTSTRFNSISTSGSSIPASASISTPLKKQPQPASTSTAPLPRTRTFSTSTIGSSGATRLGSKASLGLPPSSRYQVKS